MKSAIVIQQPGSESMRPAELLLLFHGVGSRAEDLVPLGVALAEDRPGAWVISVRSPDPSDFGSGWQWFSVRGITEENRLERVAAAMPAFLDTVSTWQHETQVSAAATSLIGFSQGAIMALESTQLGLSPAARVCSIAGRFAHTPRRAPAGTSVHLMHGDADPVMPARLGIEAHECLSSLGAMATLDRFAGLAHGIDGRVVDCLRHRLSTPTAGGAPS